MHLLKTHCDISFSERTLKRRLQKNNLRKNSNTEDSVLRTIINRELQAPSQCLGYRGIWHLLRKSYSMQVPHERVMQILREEDPEGTTQQRAHKLVQRDYFSFGSNFCWHCDNYGKLEPYGLPIYGAVDGFLRKVICLKVCRTNCNPMVVAAMYIRVVQPLGLVPEMLRTDHGNETGVMAAAHCILKQNADAHRYETSVANQRIENFWSHFCRTFTSWPVNFFKQMIDEGLLELGNHFHMQCIWFSFSDLLQFELNNFAKHWNTHHIWSSKPNCIAGVSDQLFTSPEE